MIQVNIQFPQMDSNSRQSMTALTSNLMQPMSLLGCITGHRQGIIYWSMRSLQEHRWHAIASSRWGEVPPCYGWWPKRRYNIKSGISQDHQQLREARSSRNPTAGLPWLLTQKPQHCSALADGSTVLEWHLVMTYPKALHNNTTHQEGHTVDVY